MQEPREGGVLTAEQIAVNASCLQTLSAFEKAAEGRAKIDASEHKQDHAQDPRGGLGLPNFPAPTSMALPNTASAPVQVKAALPTIQMILGDERGHYTATLHMPDGGTLDVSRGTQLPTGEQVAIVTDNAVWLRRDKTLTRLADDDGQPSQPASQNPVRSNPAPPAMMTPGLYPALPTGVMR